MEPVLRGKTVRISVSGDAGDEQRSIISAAIAADLAQRYPMACVTVEGQRHDLIKGQLASLSDDSFAGVLAVVDGSVDSAAVVMRIQRDTATAEENKEKVNRSLALRDTQSKMVPCIPAGEVDFAFQLSADTNLIIDKIILRPDATRGLGMAQDMTLSTAGGKYLSTAALNKIGDGLYGYSNIVELDLPLHELVGNTPVEGDERRGSVKVSINLFLDMNLFVYRLSIAPMNIINTEGFVTGNLELMALVVDVAP